MKIFDLTGPLPSSGMMLSLQASAGTGKTYSIATLVTRFVAEKGMPLSKFLLMTFSRAATAELRTRVFQQLQKAIQTIDEYLTNRTSPKDDLGQALINCNESELAKRRSFIVEAISQIDLATITTVHEFCSRMLRELGVLVDHDPHDKLSDQIDVLIDEAIKDEYLARCQANKITLDFSVANLVAKARLANPGLPMLPSETSATPERARFARAVDQRVHRRKQERQIMTYDDMVLRLDHALYEGDAKTELANTLAEKFPVVMVDEFQDTDPSQWRIIRQAFQHRSTIILIGDPKQSIYGFRNADLHSYAQAVNACDEMQSLSVNYRSDKPLVDATYQLFDQLVLGANQMVNKVAAHHTHSRLRSSDETSPWRIPIQIRSVAQDLPNWKRSSVVATDVLRVIDQLIDSNVQIFADEAGAEPSWRPVQGKDIAILTHSNKDGQHLHDLLNSNGITAVFAGDQSVFDTDAARDWGDLLKALIEPGLSAVSKLAMCPLAKLVLDEIPTAEGTQQAAQLLENLRQVAKQGGVVACFALLNTSGRLYKTLNSKSGQLRYLTDLRHLVELSNHTQVTNRFSLPQLVRWLEERQQFANTSADTQRLRRLDTEQNAVTIRTLHSAKGLQFPIVLLPTVGVQRIWPRKGRINEQWDIGSLTLADGQRVIELCGRDPEDLAETIQSLKIADELRLEEDLRLLYVAFTRAKSAVVAWWRGHEHSSLDKALDARSDVKEKRVKGCQPNNENTLLDPKYVHFEQIPTGNVVLRHRTKPKEISLLAPLTLSRSIDTNFSRTSYSALVSADHHVSWLTGRESDEPVDSEPYTDSRLTFEGDGQESLMAELPGGVNFGSLVHSVLEQVDPASADLCGQLTNLIEINLARYHVPDLAIDNLSVALEAVLTTPLGKQTNGMTLRDLGKTNRLAELDFELVLPTNRHSTTLKEIAKLFSSPAFVEPADPMRAYGPILENSSAASRVLCGFLTGSIDAVLQIPGDKRKFVVVDYKTNRVPIPPTRLLRVEDYQYQQMQQVMFDSHYPLQALLYSVALHRYLSYTLDDYDPKVNLGGIEYLFLRGMSGPETPVLDSTICGVFSWQPKASLIVAASNILGEEGDCDYVC